MSTRDTVHRRLRVTPDPLRRRVIVDCACGQPYAVPIPHTTTMRDWLQRAHHAHASDSARTTGVAAGCHVGDVADFDHYMDINGISLDAAGEAFADYLQLQHGWAGQAQRVDLHGLD